MNIRAFMVFVTDDEAAAYDTLAQFTGAPIEVIRESRSRSSDRRRS
jgi:hypothetical protein